MSDYNHLTPQAGADTIGTALKCLLIQSSGYLTSLRKAKEALDDGDVDHAKLILDNAFQGNNPEASPPVANIENLGMLLYSCLPRSGMPTSYG